ncbi:MAG: twin-arginine translocase TatA/TatE family subunit [Dehalococcoidia bacterium]|mgnify:CR=1 FL=1|nr:MAG: twin-arginine translocase TatA/TatE family subunit [Chloroflexi bacterium TMED70]|tara:strand:- start:810 stop:983 length:174 start_codon:yes stop_codon:yes gene_type:complete
MGFIQNLGPLQLVLIVVVILVLFGVGKLPQVGKGVGQAISEFKAALNKSDKEDEKKD